MTVSWYSRRKNLPDGENLHRRYGCQNTAGSAGGVNRETKTFTTPEFYYRGGRAEFYQDPQDPMKKHAIIGLTFNAPADVKNLESRLSMTRDGKPVPYTVTVMNCCHLC